MKNLLKILFLNLLFTTSLLAQDEEFGLASYYSDLFHGKPTASGELYDKTKFTAAHKTLAFGTMLKVTRLDNNKSVQVRVTDRGPFISGRVVEVSRAAAESLGLIQDGSTRVKVEIVKTDQPAEAVAETPRIVEEKPKPAEVAVTTPITAPASKPTEPKADKPAAADKSVVVNKKPAAKEEAKAAAPAAKEATSNAVLVKGSDFQPYDLFEIELKRPEKKGYGVQVAVLSSQEALFKKIGDLQEDWFTSILVSVQKNSKGELMYKVILGSFATEDEASTYKENLKKNKKIKGFVVDLATMGTKG
ncbi:MAG: septal ring lytic transglycosylase RlpA family protein [Saprospiraceae bacterium]|nr:septal ring lytic transglycosylase RlpA family protein [Saprospiraceae bacterium]MCF8250226.1 septal ring lytic transglycosylase RlpA family protein [Saprospiraceae bacterium]MCF8280011.1 septal ring lytic transglycosylase RlpA family protein [Bacteroidales bacterium]MCF8312034.1 septal ring lytic transglycosylase RlpA family protein [Saprospiraceae bacterium]MCF8441131.1 septal ring lytic transglycosylase RlpA family protein [Saprospiraceae bacterium]